jgi:hypothetical protein
MVNYTDGKVYRVVPTAGGEPGDTYIGSTAEKHLSRRMTGHRRNYKQWLEGKRNYTTVYSIFEKYGVDNCEIVLLETVKSNTLDVLRSRERHYIETMECCNKVVPGRTPAEYRTANRDKILAQDKVYREGNHDKLSAQEKVYREANKDKLSAREKVYREANKDNISARDKARYEANRDRILAQQKIYRSRSEPNSTEQTKYVGLFEIPLHRRVRTLREKNGRI